MRKIVISQKIKEYRSKQKVTQKELAELLGVTCQSISKWERGECYPDIVTLPLIAEVIGCPVDDFFT